MMVKRSKVALRRLKKTLRRVLRVRSMTWCLPCGSLLSRLLALYMITIIVYTCVGNGVSLDPATGKPQLLLSQQTSMKMVELFEEGEAKGLDVNPWAFKIELLVEHASTKYRCLLSIRYSQFIPNASSWKTRVRHSGGQEQSRGRPSSSCS